MPDSRMDNCTFPTKSPTVTQYYYDITKIFSQYFRYWNLQTVQLETFSGTTFKGSFINLTAAQLDIAISDSTFSYPAVVNENRDFVGINLQSGIQFRAGTNITDTFLKY